MFDLRYERENAFENALPEKGKISPLSDEVWISATYHQFFNRHFEPFCQERDD
jgi:hypothetical protein